MKDQIEKQAIEEIENDLRECHTEFPDENMNIYTDYSKTAEKMVGKGYRKQEWISVENPPETYRDEYDELIPFLVCCKGTVYPFRAVYDGTNWGDGIGKLKVTHWMPLPEAPKMKGGAE